MRLNTESITTGFDFHSFHRQCQKNVYRCVHAGDTNKVNETSLFKNNFDILKESLQKQPTLTETHTYEKYI